MLGKPGDLIESIKPYADGAREIPHGSIGVIKRVDGNFYTIEWVNYRDDFGYVWHSKRFRIITHGRKV